MVRGDQDRGATTPFGRGDLAEPRTDAPVVVRRRVPAHAAVYAARGWEMFPRIDRVYVNHPDRRFDDVPYPVVD